MQGKRLYRSASDRKLAGVCGGLAQYMGVDATLVRLVWILLTLGAPPLGLLGYLVAVWIVPPAPGPRAEAGAAAS